MNEIKIQPTKFALLLSTFPNYEPANSTASTEFKSKVKWALWNTIPILMLQTIEIIYDWKCDYFCQIYLLAESNLNEILHVNMSNVKTSNYILIHCEIYCYKSVYNVKTDYMYWLKWTRHIMERINSIVVVTASRNEETRCKIKMDGESQWIHHADCAREILFSLSITTFQRRFTYFLWRTIHNCLSWPWLITKPIFIRLVSSNQNVSTCNSRGNTNSSACSLEIYDLKIWDLSSMLIFSCATCISLAREKSLKSFCLSFVFHYIK